MSTLPGLCRLDGLVIEAPTWGVDPSTKAIDLGVLLPDGRERRAEWATMPVRQFPKNPAQRLEGIEHDLARFIAPFRESSYPALVLVEVPFAAGGRHVDAWSFFVAGAVVVAMERALRGSVVDVIAPNSWRKLAYGQGFGNLRRAAAKAKALEFCSEELGYDGGDENQAEALGLAVAGAFRVAASGG